MTATGTQPTSGGDALTPDRVRAAADRQGRIGLALAAGILTSWIALHVYTMAVFRFDTHPAWLAVILGLVLCWLYVGMFIVAHDCMHGSLAPLRTAVNRRVGQLCLLLYAGFDFDALNRKHHLHHRHSGTEGDPDYDARPPHGFFRWYLKFFSEYFSGREFIIIAVVATAYQVAGVPLVNILAFWAAPALASSLQLFTFGTYLPHHPAEDAFTDRHRTRSNDLPHWLSLLTCFHFGYHHEHHDRPSEPWWRLPAARHEARLAGRTGTASASADA